MSQKLRIVFMGTPDFSVPALVALAEAGHDIAAVYTQPPRPSGRGQQVHKSAVHRRAGEMGIPVFTPQSLKKDKAAQEAFAALQPDIAVIVAYGLILPAAVLKAPRHGCLNIHASLLPRWRGAAPIQRAILAGDRESGVCIMQMEEGLDTGPVLKRGIVPISDRTTAPGLHDDLAALGARLIVETLDDIASGHPPPPQIQSNDGVTYAAMLSRQDGRIDWTRPATEIERQLRALSPWPGVWFEAGGKTVKLLEARVTGGKGTPGTILDKSMTVACGTGALVLSRLQPADRKPMDGTSFINGKGAIPGDILT